MSKKEKVVALEEKPAKKKMSTGRIILEVVEWFFVIVILAITALILIFASKKPSSKSSASIFGYETRLVISGSMDQADPSFYQGKNYQIGRIKTGSLVFLYGAPIDSDAKMKDFSKGLAVGDVITFLDPEHTSLNADPVTHRIIAINGSGSSLTFTTMGDNNQSPDSSDISYKNVLGKVVGQSYVLGQLYINFFSNKYAVAATALIPSLAVITYEVIKIVKIVKTDKKEQLEAVEASKTDEDRIKELEEQINKIKKKGEDKK